MSGIALTGSLPGQINENTPLWDWIGQLRLNINPALIRFVDIIGIGSNFFDVSLNRGNGVLTFAPISMADHEWFVANNISTNISFQVQFYMTDGSVQLSQATYSVTLLNIDDTPPQALTFASGGTVAAGAAGANIGRLQVSDPDTASGFTFTIREDDQWVFEVVGDMLRLRAGVSIPLADGPERDVVITVSDGRQSSAMTISIGVTALGINNGGTVDLLESHEAAFGFRWAGPGNLFTMRMSHELASIRDYGSIIHIQLRDGGSVTFEQPAVIDMLDGYISFSGDGLAGRVWTIYETLLNREPRHAEMAAGVERLAGGASNQTLIGEVMATAEFANGFGALSNSAFANQLYLNSVGWTSASGVAFHAGNMDRGTSRSQVVNEFVTWRLDSLNHADTRAANGGFFVPRKWVEEWDQPVVPTALNANTFGLWLAEEMMSGRLDFFTVQGMISATRGILPELRTGQSQLEVLIRDMAGAPAESNWGTAFSEALLKRGSNSTVYLQDLIRNYDLDELQAHMLPQGIAFQAGW
ncbi:MAG: DUF4214 domain-containing protein [Roseococcus sp.]|nr:DUF4214 domain-containing protein [Roseococcus sp.]